MSNMISNPEEFEDEDLLCPKCECCEMIWEICNDCGGHGFILEDDDPWEKEASIMCEQCDGKGGCYICTCDENGKHK